MSSSFSRGCFRFADFSIESCVDLGLPLAGNEAVPDLAVAWGQAPEKLAQPAVSSLLWEIAPGHLLYRTRRAGRFLVREGREILIAPLGDIPLRKLLTPLLGLGLAAACYQRGLLLLHGCAIATPVGAVAFVGPSGAGKSTLAAQFVARGYPLLTEEPCALVPKGEGFCLYPTIPCLRLCRDAIHHLEIPEHQLKESPGIKREWEPRHAYRDGPLPLRHVYLLEEARGPSVQSGIDTVRGGEAVQALLAQSYQRNFAEAILGLSGHFAACAGLAAKVEVHRLRRPLDFSTQERLIGDLERSWSA